MRSVTAIVVASALIAGVAMPQMARAQVLHPRRPDVVVNRILFHGIDLSPEQRAELLKWRRTQTESERQTPGLLMTDAERDTLREARRSSDTVRIKQIVSRNRAKAEGRRDAQFAAIRQMLKPEQRAQFDQNTARFRELQHVATQRADTRFSNATKSPHGK